MLKRITQASFCVIILSLVSHFSIASVPEEKKKSLLLPNDPKIKLRYPIRDPNYDLNLGLSLKRGDMKQVERWYNAGADVNALDKDGLSFLYQTIQRNRIAQMKYLLLRRANVNRRNEDGTFPLEAAVYRANLRVAEYLFERGASARGWMRDKKRTYLQYMVDRRQEAFAIRLIEQGANVNTRYADGSTLLHRAASLGLTQVVAKLLEKHVAVNTRDRSGATALHEAAAKGYSNIMHQLIQAKADVDITTQKNWTPLHHAARFGHQQAVRYLISQGASLYIKNSDGKIPAQLARQLNHDNVYTVLSSHGRLLADQRQAKLEREYKVKQRQIEMELKRKQRIAEIELKRKQATKAMEAIMPTIASGEFSDF